MLAIEKNCNVIKNALKSSSFSSFFFLKRSDFGVKYGPCQACDI